MKSAAERVRDRRERLKSQGFCIVCLSVPRQADKTMCSPCQTANYQRVVARRKKAKLSGVR